LCVKKGKGFPGWSIFLKRGKRGWEREKEGLQNKWNTSHVAGKKRGRKKPEI